MTSTVVPMFPGTVAKKGMYESFYLRAVSPDEPVGVWFRYTVHKRPGQAPRGSLWCTVFDAKAGSPFMHKLTTEQLTSPADGWIEIGGDSRLGPGVAEGVCGPARWSLRFSSEEPELRHLKQAWLYKAPLPRTKLTSPLPGARASRGPSSFPTARCSIDGWRGMVGHNWGSEHAERWIWLHGVGFQEDPEAWLDVALGRVLVAGRLTPWMASGAISLNGRRTRLGGLGARGLQRRGERLALHALAPRRKRVDRRSSRRHAAGSLRRLALRRSRWRRARRGELLGGEARAQRAPARWGGHDASHTPRGRV